MGIFGKLQGLFQMEKVCGPSRLVSLHKDSNCAVKAAGGLTLEVLLGHSSDVKNTNILCIDLFGTVAKIGAGRRLHNHVLSIAKQQGCGISMLRSLDSARTFWSELGYREWSEGNSRRARG